MNTALYTAALVLCAGSGGVSAADLPLPCTPGACTGASTWVATPGNATMNITGNHLEIVQMTDRQLYNWAEFNIGNEHSVNFDQPGADSIALNRIYQGSPSQILGRLTSDGQVYLLNPNGILFGDSAQINVRGLVASSLDINDEAIENGILAPQLLQQGEAAFSSDGRVFVLDSAGNPVLDVNGEPVPVRVIVEEGATIETSDDGGRVMLLGQQVDNAGRITADKGQIILGAGEKVYLQASDDPELRGLLIEVDAGGQVWNQLTGSLESSLGNVTMAGLVVRHDGDAAASTSVASNGSVRLLARDTVDIQPGIAGRIEVNARRAGSIELGGSATIRVTPDAEDTTTAVDEQTQSLSRIELQARDITLKSGAELAAAGGEVKLTALPDPSVVEPGGLEPLPADPLSGITIEAGAVIDVSGAQSSASAARNVVEVELRANELRDAPLQRDGPLRGQAVKVDIRKGTPLADVSGAVATIERDVNERLGEGGTVVLDSQGFVDLQDGSTIDVSGGVLEYTRSAINTSLLVDSRDELVSISNASPDVPYKGILNEQTAAPFASVDPGYQEGFDAGTVVIAGRELAVNGTLVGETTAGRLQQTADTAPKGGRLVIGDADGQGLPSPDYKAPAVTLSNQGVANVLPATHIDLGFDRLVAGGFTRTEVYSNGPVDVAAGAELTLPPGGSLALTGPAVDVAGDIRIPSGTVQLRSVSVEPTVNGLDAETRAGVRVADGVSIDVSGNWNNVAAEALPALDGGSINIEAAALESELVLGDGVSLRADAGAFALPAGTVLSGDGGAVRIAATGPDTALDTGANLEVSAYGFSDGGSLELAANQLRVAAGDDAFTLAQRVDPLTDESAQPYVVSDQLYGSGGFDNVSLVATGGRIAGAEGDDTDPLTIAADAAVDMDVERLRLTDAAVATESGADIRDVAQRRELLPTELARSVVEFALAPNQRVTTANSGGITTEAGSVIDAGTAGTVGFSAPSRIDIDGRVVARGGDVFATVTNPPSALDTGFDPAAGIYLGANAEVDVSGTTIFTSVAPGDPRQTGEVLTGGDISLRTARGSIGIAEGAELEASGTAAELLLPDATGVVLEARTVASAGGSIALVAPESMTLDGTMRAQGGTGEPGESVSGGSLDIVVSRVESGFNTDPELQETYPDVQRRIRVTGDDAGAVAEPGVTAVADDIAAQGGFANLTLNAEDGIEFAGPVALRVDNRLRLVTPNLTATGSDTVDLSAAYVGIGPRLRTAATPTAAAGGEAMLRIEADLIDLLGQTATQGFGDVRLTAGSAIRASGLPYSNGLTGRFTVGGDMQLQAQQVYPTSYSEFVLESNAADGRIRIEQGEQPVAAPLSAFSQLIVRADEIQQDGTLAAPLGRIALDAGSRLELGAGSVTSAAAAGDILFGKVLGGDNWSYEIQPGTFENIAEPLAKQVTLQGADIEVAAGAQLDISGGGDVVAYEFIPGPGGSVDALDPVNSNGRFYAILPELGDGAGPFDTQEFAGSDLQPGDTLRVLNDVNQYGLEAGDYTLLPARYALQPGAILVEVLPDDGLALGGVTELSDGTAIVAGQRSAGGAVLETTLPQNFAIRDGAYADVIAEFRRSRGNEFFPEAALAADRAIARVARDAGRLSVQVEDELSLEGDLVVAAEEGGRGAEIDISAARLLVVDDSNGGADDVVEIDVAQLGALGAESLLLGGTRVRVGDASLFDTARKEELAAGLITLTDGTELALEGGRLWALDSETAAETLDLTVVLLAADEIGLAEGVELTGDEVILAATNRIELAADASLRSGAATNSVAERLLLLDRQPENAGGVLARVSGRPQVDVLRSGDATAGGDYFADSGAGLTAAGSVTIDAAGSVRSLSGFDSSGSSLSLGSGRIVLGAEQADVSTALALSAADLAGFTELDELRLIGRQGVELRNDVSLSGEGGNELGRLVFDTPVLEGDGTNAEFRAGEILVTNTSGNGVLSSPDTGGSFSLSASELRFGSGPVAIDSYASANLRADDRVLTAGDAALLSGTADVNIDTPLLSGASGSSLTIVTAGDFNLVSTAPDAGQVDPLDSLGAAVDVSAANVLINSRVVLPSGRLNVEARRVIELGETGSIDLAGASVVLPGKQIDTPGGSVFLNAGGDVTTAANSVIDISAGGNSQAGELGITGATVSLQGELRANADSAEQGGSVRVVADSISNFGRLLDALGLAGFSRSQYLETTSGNLNVAGNRRVTAGDITLAASGGNLNVAGVLDASGAQGGRIELAARNDLNLQSGSELLAVAGEDGRDGGDVRLVSATGTVDASGATVNVAGAEGGRDGRLHVRAQATAADVSIAALPASVSGARAVIIEPVQEFAAGSALDAVLQGTVESALTDYMQTAPATIADRLGVSNDSLYVVRPGAEIRADDDLTVTTEWDFANVRYGDQPGYLTIRSQGDVDFAAGLLDGFVTTGFGPTAKLEQLEGDSWSFAAVAGADMGSALTLATRQRGFPTRTASGNSLTIGNDADIRTGTGDIDLAANFDLVFAGPKSAVYTTGVAARPQETSGFGLLAVQKNWARDGGDISLTAGRDLAGVKVDQFLTGWTVRSGGAGTRAQWAIDFDVLERVGFNQVLADSFNQGVGTLAGGDIDLRAGRDVRSMFATVNSTGTETAIGSGEFDVWGGGSLDVNAGRDVIGGGFANVRGDSRLTAGRDLAADPTSGSVPLHTLLSQGEGDFAVTARNNLRLESAINPTSTAPGNLTGRAFFFTASDNDNLSLLALGGDVELYNQPAAFASIVGSDLAQNSAGYALFPADFGAYAPSGDINMLASFGILPGSTGNLELVARGNLRMENPTIAVLMSDDDPSAAPSRTNPFTSPLLARQAVENFAANAIHVGDAEPALLVAAEGNIDGGIYGLPKSVFAFAGRDIRNVRLQAQNTGDEQISVVQAGRDIRFGAKNDAIEVAGPGRLVVAAGRDINLGFSDGIATIGNTRNSNLPFADGADVTVLAGLNGRRPFAADPGDAGLPELEDAFFAVIEQSGRDAVDLLGAEDQVDAFRDWLAEEGLSAEDVGLTEEYLDNADRIGIAQLYARGINAIRENFGLATLSGDAATTFVAEVAALTGGEPGEIVQILRETNVLSITDGAVNTIEFPFYAGFVSAVEEAYPGADIDAVSALIPERLYDGNVFSAFSKIYTVDGGNINIYTPGDLVNVGLANPPENSTVDKPPSELGIVAQSTGDVRMFADGDVLVNQSRIFTLAGGDIIIWSSNGDIDAGRGAKSSISAPPPVITVDASGQVQISISGAIAGSGIRGILTGDQEAGDVVLIAPTGDVNAGDAGIGSAGDALIAAVRCVGCDNIQTGGSVSGNTGDAGAGLGDGLAVDSSATASATKAAEDAAADELADSGDSPAEAALGWLEVFVEGFGDDEEEES